MKIIKDYDCRDSLSSASKPVRSLRATDGISFQVGQTFSDYTTHGAGLLALRFAFMAIRACGISALLCQIDKTGLAISIATCGAWRGFATRWCGAAGGGGLAAFDLLGAIHERISKICRWSRTSSQDRCETCRWHVNKIDEGVVHLGNNWLIGIECDKRHSE